MADVDLESGTGGGAKFDAYADNYEQLNEKSQRASGEPPSYFAQYKLRCLEPDARYVVANLDGDAKREMTGRELTEHGLLITIPQQPGAALITYKKKRPAD